MATSPWETSGQAAALIAERLDHVADRPVELDGRPVPGPRASVGTVVVPVAMASVDQILALADARMYAAKHAAGTSPPTGD